MSVYTVVDAQTITEFLRRYRLGKLRDFEGIAAGIENTNYFLTTDSGRYVLTIFEQTDPDDLQFCFELMAHLSMQELPCAAPIADCEGRYLQCLASKPAVIVECLDGRSVDEPHRQHFREVGETLARLHGASANFGAHHENVRGHAWVEDTAARVGASLDPTQQRLLDRELEFQRRVDLSALPHGVIHADLFRDNVLFSHGGLSGVIDFYYACDGPLIYDLAVTVADWCFDEQARFAATKAQELIRGYQRHRGVSSAEIDAWMACLRIAGMRFWLSRVYDRLYPRQGHMTQTKDPSKFRLLLEACHDRREVLLSAWQQ